MSFCVLYLCNTNLKQKKYMSVVTEASNKTFRLVGSLSSVLALVVGIPCLLLSFVPLFGAFALYPSIFAFVCAIVGLVFAVKAGSSTSASIAGLVITLIALTLSWASYKAIQDAFKRSRNAKTERNY